jgi:hypothetical protein
MHALIYDVLPRRCKKLNCCMFDDEDWMAGVGAGTV